MADVTGTISTIDAILKDNQTAKTVQKQFVRSSGLFDKLNKNLGGFWGDAKSGRRYLQPIETEPMTAYSRFVSSPQGSTFDGNYAESISRAPSGEKTRMVGEYNPLSYINASLRFDLNVIARAGGTGPSQAFIAEVSDRIAGVAEAISAEVSRQLHMATGDGTLGDANATVSVDGSGLVTCSDAFWEKIVKRNILVIGSKVQLWPASSGVPTTGAADYTTADGVLVVSSVDASAKTIQLSTTAGTLPTTSVQSDGDVAIGLLGNRTWDGSSNGTTEITSIPMVVDGTGNTKIGGLDSTDSWRWRGNQKNVGGAFNVPDYMELLEQIDANGGIGKNTFVFADRIRFNSALLALTTNLIGSPTHDRIQYGSTSQVEAQFRQEIPLQDGTTLVQERQTQPGVLDIVDTDHAQILDIDGEKVRWIGATGGTGGPDSGTMLMWDGNFGYYGSAFFNGDLVIDKRNCHGQLTGLS